MGSVKGNYVTHNIEGSTNKGSAVIPQLASDIMHPLKSPHLQLDAECQLWEFPWLSVSSRGTLGSGLPPPAFPHSQAGRWGWVGVNQKCTRDALWDRLRGLRDHQEGLRLKRVHRHDTLQRRLPALAPPPAPFLCSIKNYLVEPRQPAPRLTLAISIVRDSHRPLMIYTRSMCETQ